MSVELFSIKDKKVKSSVATSETPKFIQYMRWYGMIWYVYNMICMIWYDYVVSDKFVFLSGLLGQCTIYFHLLISVSSARSSRPEVLCKKSVHKNFAKLTRKHLCLSVFLKKVERIACNFIKKETLLLVLSCEFCEIFMNTYFYRIPLVAGSDAHVLEASVWEIFCTSFKFISNLHL